MMHQPTTQRQGAPVVRLEVALERRLQDVVAERDAFLEDLKAGEGQGVPRTPEERRRWSILCWERRALELRLECLSLAAREAEARASADRARPTHRWAIWAGREARRLDCEVDRWARLRARKDEELAEARSKLTVLGVPYAA